MKAITFAKYGPPEVLQVRDVVQPEPVSDELLIQVRAAEATKADCEMRSFTFSVKWFWLPLRVAMGVIRPRRQILGNYFSGVVAAIGKDVKNFAAGDEVYGSTGLRAGAYGEYLVVPASSTVASKPRNMSFDEAAAVPLGGLNALHFMRLAAIQAGDCVLIIGAGGSIGAHAVQIAKSMGARVTAVDSGIKETLLRRLGADRFINYEIEDVLGRDDKYDVIFDMVPTSDYKGLIRALRSHGRYLCGNPRLSVMLRCVLTTRFSDKTARFAFARESVDELRDLTSMIENGAIRSIVGRVLTMNDAVAAHELVETEQRIGAIVLRISDPDPE